MLNEVDKLDKNYQRLIPQLKALKLLGLKKEWDNLIKWSKLCDKQNKYITYTMAEKVCQTRCIPFHVYELWANMRGFTLEPDYLHQKSTEIISTNGSVVGNNTFLRSSIIDKECNIVY